MWEFSWTWHSWAFGYRSYSQKWHLASLCSTCCCNNKSYDLITQALRGVLTFETRTGRKLCSKMVSIRIAYPWEMELSKLCSHSITTWLVRDGMRTEEHCVWPLRLGRVNCKVFYHDLQVGQQQKLGAPFESKFWEVKFHGGFCSEKVGATN